MQRNYCRNKLSKHGKGKKKKWQKRNEPANKPEQLVGVYQAMSMEHPEVLRMEREVIWRCPVKPVPLLGSWVSWRSKSMHLFLLPLTPRLSSSPAKVKGQPRTDEQHRAPRLYRNRGALLWPSLAPPETTTASSRTGRSEVGLAPPFFDKRTGAEKKAAVGRKKQMAAKKEAGKKAAVERKKQRQEQAQMRLFDERTDARRTEARRKKRGGHGDNLGPGPSERSGNMTCVAGSTEPVVVPAAGGRRRSRGR
jgi:hypothetical protein